MAERANGQHTTQGLRDASPGVRSRFAAALVGCLAATAAGPACDTNARFNPNRTVFQDLVVVSAYPAVQQNGQLVRQCAMDPAVGGDPDGFLVNFVMVSSPRKGRPGSSDSLDADNSIRPGDIINTVEVLGSRSDAIKVNQQTLDFTIDCIDGLPDASPGTCMADTTLSASGIAYQPFAKSRSAAHSSGHNIVFLVDHTASIRGLVKESDLKEGTPGTFDPEPNFSQVASDYTHRRIAVVEEFINKLNPSDRFGVLAFGEGIGSGADNMTTACSMPEVEGLPWNEALDMCFGRSNQKIWTDGLEALRNSSSGGRSNLWYAVNQAYGYLTQKRDLNRTNHIVILTDGPDTCLRESESFTSCDKGTCTSEKVSEIIRRLEEDKANPNLPAVHIHFVQFESFGYPGPDPRQQEIACLTNGHYQFINSNELSTTNVVEFQKALSSAMTNVRLSLQGVWQASVPAPVFKSNSAPPFGTPRGGQYALGGRVDISPESKLVSQAQLKTFSNAGGSTWDKRLVIRKPCAADVDCGLEGDGVCQTGCSEETQLCRGELELPNNMACLDGSGGTCCDGECLAGGAVCGSCNQ